MSDENWRVGFEHGSVTANAVERNPGWTPVVGDVSPFAFGGVVALVDEAKNAPLIAAAPSLFAALDEIINYGGGAGNALDDPYVVERAQLALSKARGVQPT